MPRTEEWHVRQRLPDALKTWLQPKINDLIEIFGAAGLEFDEFVTLTWPDDDDGADLSLDLSSATDDRIRALGIGICSSYAQFEADVVKFFTEETVNRRRCTSIIEQAMTDALRLPKNQLNALKAKILETVHAEVAPDQIAKVASSRHRHDWVDQLEGGEGPLVLAGPRTAHDIDVMIADVYARAPWMDAQLERIWHLAKAHVGEGLGFPPILLHGPGGTGKSMLASLISDAAGVPSHEMDGSAGSAAFRVAGLEAGWSSSRIGEPLRFIAEQRCANPLMIINELDKAAGGAQSSNGTATSLIHALLPLLDPHSATSWRCPASGLVCDMSRLNWIFTANELDQLSQPFLSRLEVIQVPAMTKAQYLKALDVLCPDDELMQDFARRFIEENWQHPRFSLRLLARAINRLSAKDQSNLQ
ncbi:AAA family ATPase [Tropicibacter alexandrii]|uniref:AAA family ATPase n=1 Tax=Tropicibacter alexandrii TaxID=2267683 RepID=UPI0013E8EB21|nr:AAA family ATPase [Tropicibacter alexandrii]